MSTPSKPLVYFILGAAGSGRREVVADLIEGGLGEGDRTLVLLSAEEAPQAADERLGRVERWRWIPADKRAGGGLGGAGMSVGGMAGGAGEGDDQGPSGAIEAEVPEGTTHVFLITDGRADPVDQVEAFKVWLGGGGGWSGAGAGWAGAGAAFQRYELARVICVVNCGLASRHSPLAAWYDACIHFSDIVLLARREGVPNKWIGDFQARYKDQFYPCVFEFLRGGRVANPPAVLVPEARRMSHVFEEDADWVVTGEDGAETDAEDDPTSEGDGEEEIEARMAVDPYLERRQGGRRVRELPKIAKLLDEDARTPPVAPPQAGG